MRSRPQISWSELAGARVGIWGLGVEGAASLRKLASLGTVPAVLVDDDPQRVPAELRQRVVGAEAGGVDALAGCDVVVKAPGISRYRPEIAALEAGGTPVVGGLGLWMAEADRDRVVCVTGTKGKSTTVTILGHLMRGLGQRCLVGGNVGVPPYDPEAPQDVDWWAIETSSYQVTDLAKGPRVVAVTSLHPDHLHWHAGDVERYYADKLALCTLPGVETAIVNGEDEVLAARAEQLGPVRWVRAEPATPDWISELGVLGHHNELNALIARTCLLELGVPGAADDAVLEGASSGFTGLDSRLQTIGTLDGVDFVDDSLSTNVLPTLTALRVFDGRPVALLAGGQDRGIDYRELGVALRTRGWPTLLVALPTTGAKIAALAESAPDVSGELEVRTVDAEGESEAWLAGAVADAFAWAQPRGGVVLLSPASASFDHFTDYRHRARAFAAGMRRCASASRR